MDRRKAAIEEKPDKPVEIPTMLFDFTEILQKLCF